MTAAEEMAELEKLTESRSFFSMFSLSGAIDEPD